VAALVALLLVLAVSAACDRGPAPPDVAALAPADPEVQAYLRELTAAVDRDRASAAAWGRLGMAYEANGFLPQAEAAYRRATTLDAGEPRWRYLGALLRARRGEVREALADLEPVAVGGYVPARWRTGLWRLDLGDTAGATAAFRAVVEVAPSEPAGPIGLALVHLAQRQEADAVALLEALLKASPGERYALQLLGTAYRRLGREDDARFALSVGRTGQPAWPDPYLDEVARERRGFAAQLKEATALAAERRFDEALPILQRLSTQRADDIALQVYLGGIYATAGRTGEARAILEPIVAAAPQNFDAQMHLASTYLFAGDLDRAAACAGRAAGLRPGSAAAAKLQGVALWQQGRLDEAATQFAAALERDPRDAMPSLYLGMMLGQQGRYAEARRRFEDALARNPLLGDALLGIADTHAALGDFRSAEAALDRAAQAEPGNPRLPAARTRISAASAARGLK
jgi:tetratricopeptide (TPR) repeat protein